MKFPGFNWLDSLISENLQRTTDTADEIVDRSVNSILIPQIRNKYLLYLKEKIRFIQLPQTAAPRNLPDVFVELAVSKEVRRWIVGRIDEDRIESIPVRDALKTSRHILILGEPGAGKTTFLRRSALSICTNDDDFTLIGTENLFPVLLECRNPIVEMGYQERQERIREVSNKRRALKKQGKSADLAKSLAPGPPIGLIVCIAKELENQGFPYAETFILKLIKNKKVAIFVDGLDEAEQSVKKSLLNDLEDIRRKHQDIALVVSCRSAELDRTPEGFFQYEIQPLAENQKLQFASRWFHNRRNKAEDFNKKIQDSHLSDLTDRPLLLTLLCSLFESGGNLPRYAVDVFRESAELTLRRWDVFREIKRRSVFKDLSLNQRMDILANIAASMTKESITEIEKSRLISIVSVIMEECSIKGSPERLLDEIVGHSGIIMESTLRRYMFSHKSFQDYFTALYYSKSKDPVIPARKLSEASRWLATVEMLACLVGDAAEILLELCHSGAFGIVRNILESYPVRISHKGRILIVRRLRHYINKATRKHSLKYALVIDGAHYNRFRINEYTDEILNTIYDKKTNQYLIVNISTAEVPLEVLMTISSVIIGAPSMLKSIFHKSSDSWLKHLVISSAISLDPRGKRDYGLPEDALRRLRACLH